MKKEFEFWGIPTGDGELFCWEVDKETWRKIENREPEEYDYICLGIDTKTGELVYSKDKLYLYPDTIFRKTEDILDINANKFNKPIKIKIEWEE